MIQPYPKVEYIWVSTFPAPQELRWYTYGILFPEQVMDTNHGAIHHCKSLGYINSLGKANTQIYQQSCDTEGLRMVCTSIQVSTNFSRLLISSIGLMQQVRFMERHQALADIISDFPALLSHPSSEVRSTAVCQTIY